MAYPFVRAFYDFGPRGTVPVKAFVVHMAEGGGTVAYLAKDQPNKVSVHYVIERTGRIVRMLGEDRISGSINPRDIRTSTDKPPPDPPFGFLTAQDVMGHWHADPNRAVISLEIEGFAASGPNAGQVGSLRSLVADVRTRHPAIGLLGHRDFADYKACPGKLIPWAELGGHGLQETTVTPLPITSETPVLIDVPKGTPFLDMDGQTVLLPSWAADFRDRYSPFECGGFRAMYGTVAGVRRVGLTRFSGKRAVPEADCGPLVAEAQVTHYNAGLGDAQKAIAVLPRRTV